MTNNNQNTKEEMRGLENRLKRLKRQFGADSGNPFMVPAAILMAGLLIGGAIVYSRNPIGSEGSPTADIASAPNSADSGSGAEIGIKPVTLNDHILGDPNAPVKLVEFSDLECPFCKRFHSTMKQLIDEYGKSGQVAWVYRHFPLDSIHSKARKEAQATECANELGGNEKFWSYLDKIYEVTPSNNRLDPSTLPQIAEDIGLDRVQFEACLEGDKYVQHIENDYQDAIASGGRGTPYSVVIAENGKKFSISGAQPYSAIKSIIDLALKES